MCRFIRAWSGACINPGNSYCKTHMDMKCSSCGIQATHECEETGQFVCGAPLCDNCEHVTFPDGTNGGVGFNQRPLGELPKRHIKKTEQIHKPWYEDDSEKPQDA